MGKYQDLTGRKFGMLTAIKRIADRIEPSGRTVAMWECVCECGSKCSVSGENLRKGHTKSCGCFRKNVVADEHRTHGQRHTKLYGVWLTMKQRCGNPNVDSFCYYGAEGKTVCEEWQTFENFSKWAIASGYTEGLTIERVDGTKGYFPDNCKWATPKEQANNKRNNHLITYNGKTQTMAKWADEYGLPYGTLKNRIYKGWSIEKALTTKKRG